MKLKNLAFFGVMASILSVASAQAAEGDNYIASKGYVDNKVSTVSTNLDGNYYTKTQANTAISTAANAAQAAAEQTAAADATSKANAAQAAAEATAAADATSKANAAQSAAEQTAAADATSKANAAEQNAKDYADGKFATTTSMNTALANKADTSYVNTELAKKQNTLTFDATPTAESSNPVTSAGVKAAIDAATENLATADNVYTKGAADGKFATQTALSDGLALKANTSDLGALAAKNTVTTADIDNGAVTAEKLATAVQNAINDALVKNETITGSSANSIVQYDAKGLVVSGTAAGTLATVSPTTAGCPSGRTCVVTKDSEGNHHYTPVTLDNEQ